MIVAGSCSSVYLKAMFFHELATVACSNNNTNHGPHIATVCMYHV